MRSQSARRIACTAVVVSVILLLLTSRARADTPEIIQIDRQTVNRALPLGKAFSLKGPVDSSVTAVRGIFVETSFPLLGIIRLDKRSCQQVLDELGEIKKVEPTSVGEMKTTKIWEGGEDLYAFRLPTWKPSKTLTPTTAPLGPQFQLDVPAATFFRPGAHYCLYLYNETQIPVDADAVETKIEEFQDTWSKCQFRSGESDCQAAALRKLQDASEAVFGTPTKPLVSNEDLDKAEDALRDLKTIIDIESTPLEALLTNYAAHAYRLLPVRATVDKPLVMKVAEDPLAKLFLTLLVQEGEVQRGPSMSNSDFQLADRTPIAYLIVDAEHKLSVAAAPPSDTAKPKVLNVPLDKITLPDSGVHLLDLLEYAEGRIRVGTKYLRFGEVYRDVVLPFIKYLPSADAAEMNALFAQAKTLSELFSRETGGLQGGPAAAETTSQRVSTHLREWLRTRMLADCTAQMRVALGLNAESCAEPSPGQTWPRFREFSLSPLGALRDRVRQATTKAVRAAKAMAALRALKTVPTLEKAIVSGDKYALTKDTWSQQFLFPGVGLFACALDSRANFSFQFLAARVYLFPNPADEPMWTNGATDLRRVFAFEMGLGTSNTDFGRDKRFAGIWDGAMPPLLLGGALQVAPYLTVSGGLVIMTARRSTLDFEKRHDFVSPYVGVALDAPIVDALAAAFGKARSAKLSGE